jgi:hypothetical protein
MKWIPIILTVICINAVTVSNAFAQPCVTFDKVKGVFVNSNGDVIYVTWDGNGGTHRLAATADSPAKESMLQVLLQAASANKNKKYEITAKYPDGYNCEKGDTTTPAEWIYFYDPVVPY